MLGAIIGDIVGSCYEWNNIKTKEFKFMDEFACFLTDDSIMTLAVAEAIMQCEGNYSNLFDRTVNCMRTWGRKYPHSGYGGRFSRWLRSPNPMPYNSLGNGAAMRISPVAYVADDIYHLKQLVATVTSTTHNHPSGIKGAEATAVAIFMALRGISKKDIKAVIDKEYYNLDFYQLDDIREAYTFDETCDGTVPYAIEAFIESTSFEDAIRNAISIGGDSDTVAAITGSIAEAYYGIPKELRTKAKGFMDSSQLMILSRFEEKFGKVDPKEVPDET